MQLEQMMYEPMQIQRTELKRERVYKIVDLESLSASALYTPKIGGVGSSGYFTWMSDPQPGPDLEIKTPSSYGMINTEGVVPSSSNSLLYLNSRGQALGGIENLNSSEMSLLLKKHFGK